MKIIKVTKVICFRVKTDEFPIGKSYTRYSDKDWKVQIGESEEPLNRSEEMEALYQEWLREPKIIMNS